MSDWLAWAEDELAAVRRAGRWRAPRAFDGCGPLGEVDGRPVISFAGNDYLGMSAHPEVRAAACAAIARWGTGSGASRLVVGTRPLHEALESEIAPWKRAERALLFATGYGANMGVLSVLGRRAGTIFSDALNHASIIDGCRLARAPVRVYRHRDVAHLGQLLQAHAGPALVVTDAVFSMDGDLAPLPAIAALCAAHGALLVVDEAHAVLAEDELPDCPGLTLVRTGTLSKTLGALGGWVAGPRALIELLINRARAFIYSTAPTPADTAAALAALRLYRGVAGAALRARLRASVDRLRPGHRTPILPVLIGREGDALAASRALFARGIHVPAIRPPTVPPGTARLRIALSAAHTEAMLETLEAALQALDLGTREPHAVAS